MKLKSVTSLPLLLAVSIAMLPSCDTPPEESIDQPGASAAETPTAGQLLLGSYRASLDPVSGAWDFQPLTREESGLTSAKYAVAGTPDGDEAVNVTSNFTLANCVDGVCGCSAGASDPPGWFGTTCANYSAVGFGKVTITKQYVELGIRRSDCRDGATLTQLPNLLFEFSGLAGNLQRVGRRHALSRL